MPAGTTRFGRRLPQVPGSTASPPKAGTLTPREPINHGCANRRITARSPTLASVNPAALIIVDVQRGFEDAEYWGPRNNPGCDANISLLLITWQKRDWPVVFVRHDSIQPGSPLKAGSPGNLFQEVITGEPALFVTKQVNSAFHGTPDLEAWLRDRDIEQIVVCGITTNHCCETTARVGSNLGFQVWFPLDATHTFDRTSPSGDVFTADHLADVTATNLHEEFATVCNTNDLLAQLPGQHISSRSTEFTQK